MTYHLTLTDLSAMGVTAVSLNYRSLAADTASIRCPLGQQPASSLPWAEGDRITLADDRLPGGPRIFSGVVRRVTRSFSGSSWSMQAELANDVDILERTTFAYIDDEGRVRYAQSFYSPRAQGESAEGERLTSCRTVCERCFDWAAAGGALSCGRDVQFDATILGVAGTGSQSCWSLTATALRWVPDAMTAMRYDAAGDTLQFMTARELPALTLRAREGRIVNDAGEEVASFEGMTHCELTPRPDLVPPVCALTGRKQLVLPEGSDVRVPGAFIYHVRKNGGGGLNEAEAEAISRQAAGQALLKRAPRQLVRGKVVPLNISAAVGEVNMKEAGSFAPAILLRWWKSFSTFALLGRFDASQVTFGNPLFVSVPAADAYPPEEDEDDGGSVPGAAPLDPDAASDAAPANYDDTPGNWGKLYLFKEGAFPASVEAARNLSGLKWCRGTLYQDVWLTPGGGLPEGVSKQQVVEFFAGTYPVVHEGKRRRTRYARLCVEGIWINRRRVRYKEGSNVEDGEETPEGGETEGDDNQETGGAADPDYEAALRDFYASTRKLYHDGSLTLCGFAGKPGELLGRAINVAGLMPEWETMQTPCNAVSCDPVEGTLTLELGSRENLSLDELLERQNLGRLQADSRNYGDTVNPLDVQPEDAPEDAPEEDTEQEEQVEMIAPTINATLATAVSGKPLNPFEIFPEGGKWLMNGGQIQTHEGVINVETTDITAHYASNRRFYARPAANEKGYVLRYTDMES